MRTLIKLFALLYPKSWRDRYKNEFDALLDQVQPTWRSMIDVLRGAFNMQVKSGSLWTIVATAAIALLASVAFSQLANYGQYRSEAVIRPDEARLNTVAAQILSRSALTQLIMREHLFTKERDSVSIEDLDLWLRNSVLLWSEGGKLLRVRATAQAAADAQRTAQGVADAFVEANAASLTEPANLPTGPDRPPLKATLQFGLVAGVIGGALITVFIKLKVWKAATVLTVAGTVLCAAASLAVPDAFEGLSVVSCQTSDTAAVHGLIDSVTSDDKLSSLASQFNLYQGDPQAVQKLREHLIMTPDLRPSGNPLTRTPAGSYDIAIRFRYPDQATAQFVTEAVAADLTGEELRTRSGITVEMVAPAFVRAQPHVPNRVIGSEAGFALGLASALGFGLWRVITVRGHLRHA